MGACPCVNRDKISAGAGFVFLRGVDAHTDYDMLADGYDGKKANFPLVRASDDLSLSIVVRFVIDITEKKNKIYVKVDNTFEKRA